MAFISEGERGEEVSRRHGEEEISTLLFVGWIIQLGEGYKEKVS